jgi:hypothetical protein
MNGLSGKVDPRRRDHRPAPATRSKTATKATSRRPPSPERSRAADFLAAQKTAPSDLRAGRCIQT